MTIVFNSEATLKLKELIRDGVSVIEEISVLNEGLNDTVKAIAEEISVKPSVLKKAIKIASKQKLTEENEANEVLNQILITVGMAS